MPKVIVYVPAAAWRRLEAEGLDPAVAVREFARRGYEVRDGQLPEREVPRVGEPSQGDAASQVATRAQVAEADTEAGVDRPEPDSSRASRSGSCPMNPPRGTHCKACGKVHPL